MTAHDTKLWHTMSFADADKMIGWLTAVGFTEHATYRDEADASVVVHAEWLWPEGGGVMFGSKRPDGAVDNVILHEALRDTGVLVELSAKGVRDRVLVTALHAERNQVPTHFGQVHLRVDVRATRVREVEACEIRLQLVEVVTRLRDGAAHVETARRVEIRFGGIDAVHEVL